MSWFDYNYMFDKAQENGKYHLFVFDLKGSRTKGYFKPYINLLLYGTYFAIKNLEKERDVKILHTNEIFNKGDRGDLLEPFFFMGDLFGFTIIRGSLSAEEVYDIFKKVKAELNIPYEFYYDNAFYETDNYNENYKKYFRGYCMQYLEDRAKKKKDLL